MTSSIKAKPMRKLKFQPYKSSKPVSSGKSSASNSTKSTDETKSNIIKHSIDMIFKKNSVNLPFEELYNSAFTLVLQNKGDMLYSNLENQLIEFIGTQTGVVTCSTDALIRQISDLWKHYTTSLIMIRDILMYMDRVYAESKN